MHAWLVLRHHLYACDEESVGIHALSLFGRHNRRPIPARGVRHYEFVVYQARVAHEVRHSTKKQCG